MYRRYRLDWKHPTREGELSFWNHCGKCHYYEGQHAECHYKTIIMLKTTSLDVIMLNVIMLNAIMLNVILMSSWIIISLIIKMLNAIMKNSLFRVSFQCHHAEFTFIECHYAKCPYAECIGATDKIECILLVKESTFLKPVVVNVIIETVIMLKTTSFIRCHHSECWMPLYWMSF